MTTADKIKELAHKYCVFNTVGDKQALYDAIDEMAKDAARYRWLRDYACDAADTIGCTRWRGLVSEVIVWGEELDAAIDAELEKQQ